MTPPTNGPPANGPMNGPAIDKRIAADMRALFASELGARVLRHLMGQFGVFMAHPSIELGPLAYAEGERNVVLYILACVQDQGLSHEQFIEAADRAASEHPSPGFPEGVGP